MKFYEKIFNLRIKNIGNPEELFELPVLEKLLVIAFNNDSSPGELPSDFVIYDIVLPKTNFEKLLESFELKILSIVPVKGHYANSFRVFLINKKSVFLTDFLFLFNSFFHFWC